MIRKYTIVIITLSVIFSISCKKEVRTIPDYLRKGTAEYYTNNGYKYLNEGSLDTAGEEFRIAVKKKPGLIKAVMGLGIVYLQQMKFEESLKIFSDVIRHNPSNADAYNFIGIIHTELGHYDKAKENYLIAANSPSYNTPENAYLNLALLEMKQNKLDSALRYIEMGLVKNSEFVQFYNLKGKIYEQKGFYKEAVYNYERALFLSMEKDINIRINVARGYIKMGQKIKALNLLEKMLGEAPPPQIRKLILEMIKLTEK
jgi:Tfp pilus assembly protein PilF